MKTLIISCTTGEGHNSCAKAIKDVYDMNNYECKIVDGLAFISNFVSKFAAWGHVLLYRHFPKIFNLGYRLSEKHPSTFSPGSIIYKIFSKGTKRLRDYIVDNNYESVICTHPFAAVILTEMQNRYHLPIKTSFVATDYTCCPSVQDSNLDLYFIPDKKLIDDFCCDHIDTDKIIPSGIPIKQCFYTSKNKVDAKKALGINENNKHVVMMCGSMGCGPLKKLALNISEKASDNCEITVICGTNESLKKSLDKNNPNPQKLHILGFVKDMSSVLDSADLYLTKPGGISTTEAVAKGIPMLFVNTVAACETYNLNHFMSYKVAECAKTVKDLTTKCIELLEDDNRLTNFKNNLSDIEKKNSSLTILEAIKKQ